MPKRPGAIEFPPVECLLGNRPRHRQALRFPLQLQEQRTSKSISASIGSSRWHAARGGLPASDWRGVSQCQRRWQVRQSAYLADGNERQDDIHRAG